MKIDIWLNALSIILFLGFSTAALIAFSTIDKQKDITISSRYGRQTGPLEIIYVNVALLAVAFMLYVRSYRFLPALVSFVLLIFFKKIKSYQIVNDEISTVQVRVYANKKKYVLRCDKTQRAQIVDYFVEHGISDKVNT